MKSGYAALANPESLVPAEPRSLFVGSNIYRRAAFGNNHPLKIVRHTAVLDLVKILGWLPDSDFRETEPATVEQLLQFHDRGYVEALQYADSTGQVRRMCGRVIT